MKFTLSALAFAASLALVGAQDLSGIPTCALTCFATAVPAAGCSLSDTNCQCTTGRSSITSSVSSCVSGKCSADDIAKITPAVEAICAKAGVTITDLPTAVSSGASATASGASATTTASGTHTASGSASSATNTGAAVANVAGLGAIAFGLMAALGF